MEKYAPGVDDDPESCLEEARMQALGSRLDPIEDSSETEESSKPPEESLSAPQDSASPFTRSDEPEYFPEPVFQDEPPALLPREIITHEPPPSSSSPGMAGEPPVPREIVTSMRTERSVQRRRSRRHDGSIFNDPARKTWFLWMILGSLFTLLLVLIAVAAMVMMWAFVRQDDEN